MKQEKDKWKMQKHCMELKASLMTKINNSMKN